MLKKILLLNPPGDKLYLRDQYCSSVSKANYYWPPIDLLILSGILHEQYAVEVIDAIIDKLSYTECFNQIIKREADAVIFLTSVSSWKADAEFMRKIKDKNKQVIIIGTGGCLLDGGARIMEENAWLDAILLDFTAANILDYLALNSGSSLGIDNVIFRANNRILTGNKKSRPAYFEIPIPRHEIFPIKKYRLPHSRRHPFTSVLTGTGCPFNCPFCITAGKLAFVSRQAGNIIKELEYVQKLGIKEVLFKDHTFGANRANCRRLCQEMINHGLRLAWICSSRVDVLDEELLRLMKKAGCHTIQFGVESGNERILKIYKGITKDQIRATFRLCNKFNIRTLAHFIIGLPGEDKDSILETIAFAKELECDYAAFNIATPYEGTKLRDDAVKNGWIQSDKDILDSSCSYPTLETGGLSKEEIWKLRNTAIREFYLRPGYIFKRVFGIRSLYEFKITMEEGMALLKTLF